jgi:hypothetical protein
MNHIDLRKESLMKTRYALLTTIMAAMVGAFVLGTPTMSAGQSLIHACVNNKGALRVVTSESACTSKEHALSWPAEPSPGLGTTYYYRDHIFTVTPGFPVGGLVVCDDPADVAVRGGCA